jgi:hypothetical protein
MTDTADAVAIPDSPPSGRSEEPTTRDAGRLLAELLDVAGGRLAYATAVAALRQRFGGRFLCGPQALAWIDPLAIEFV